MSYVHDEQTIIDIIEHDGHTRDERHTSISFSGLAADFHKRLVVSFISDELIALMTASFAAHRPAKLADGSGRDRQYSISMLVKFRAKKLAEFAMLDSISLTSCKLHTTAIACLDSAKRNECNPRQTKR